MFKTKYELTNIQPKIYYSLKKIQPQAELNLSRFSVTEKEVHLKQIRK